MHSGEHLREAARLKWECIWRLRYVYWNLVHNETAGESGDEGMNSTCIDMGGHDSSVSTVTVLLAEEEWGSGFYSQQRQIFSFLQCPDRLWVAQRPVLAECIWGKATGT